MKESSARVNSWRNITRLTSKLLSSKL